MELMELTPAKVDEVEETELSPTPPDLMPVVDTSSKEIFALKQREANLYANSGMFANHYNKNVAACYVALQTAKTLNIDPFIFMQRSYPVHGKIGIEGQLVIALINSRGGFAHRLRFEYTGEGQKLAVRCWTTEKTGEVLEETFSYEEAVKCGWPEKNANWKNLPKQMLAYRAAAFFGRKYCPDVLAGMELTEEIIDVEGTQVVREVSTNRLRERLTASKKNNR